MNEVRYLVDNNALTALTGRRIESDFFAANCHITPDVLREASSRPERRVLEDCVTNVSADFFSMVRFVMSSEPVGDVRLVDLYRNKGAADPGLLATILLSNQVEDGMLLRSSWVLVTDDSRVREKAQVLGIEVHDSSQLKRIIDSSL